MLPKLALSMLRLFATGAIYATQVQELAHAAWVDGWGRGNRLAQKLAHAGHAGKFKGNVYREVMAAAKQALRMKTDVQPYKFKVRGVDESTIETFMFLPHEVLNSVASGTTLDQLCLSRDEVDAEEGLGVLLRRWAQDPAVNCDGVDLTTVAILGCHADGVQYTTSIRPGDGKSVIVASYNIISAQTTPLRSERRLAFVLQKSRLCNCGCRGYCTFQDVFAVMSWSFQCLSTGLAPSVRHDGAPFSEDDRRSRLPARSQIPRGALLQVRGDWEFFSTALDLRSASCNTFCFLCEATKHGDCGYKDFTPEAAHRQTLKSHDSYLVTCVHEGTNPSTIFQSPGTRLMHLTIDSMHAADLGVMQDLPHHL